MSGTHNNYVDTIDALRAFFECDKKDSCIRPFGAFVNPVAKVFNLEDDFMEVLGVEWDDGLSISRMLRSDGTVRTCVPRGNPSPTITSHDLYYAFTDDDRYYKLGQMVTNVLKRNVSVILMRNPYELSPTETVNRLGRFFIENYNIEGFKDMVKRSD